MYRGQLISTAEGHLGGRKRERERGEREKEQERREKRYLM